MFRYTVGSKILLHPKTTSKVLLLHPFGVYDNLRLGGNLTKIFKILSNSLPLHSLPSLSSLPLHSLPSLYFYNSHH